MWFDRRSIDRLAGYCIPPLALAQLKTLPVPNEFVELPVNEVASIPPMTTVEPLEIVSPGRVVQGPAVLQVAATYVKLVAK